MVLIDANIVYHKDHPEVTLATALAAFECGFDAVVLNYISPIDPPQYRAIGIASMPLNRVSVLTKTFIQYLTDPSKIDFNELCS